MRKTAIALLFSLLPLNVFAAPASNDAEEMGHLAGVILACGLYKPLYQFEEILSRYFSNTAGGPEAEKAILKQYAQAKASAFNIYRQRKSECAATINDFMRMPIFRSELYSDGTVRLPDGKFLYPRGKKKLAPDAQKIYPVPNE